MALPRMDEAELVLWLHDKGATKSEVWLARHLNDASAEYDHEGCWKSLRTIAGPQKRKGERQHPKGSKPITTVRLAAKGLQRMGAIAVSDERYDGRKVRVQWCLWKVPSGRLDGENFDLGGVWPKGSIAAPVDLAQTPERALFQLSEGARFSGPTIRKWTSSKDSKKTTTDAENPVVVFPAAPPGDENGGTQAGRSSETSPPPAAPPDELQPASAPAQAIDQAIAREIEQGFQDEAQRVKVLAELPACIDPWTVDWLIALVRTLALANRKKRVISFGALIATIRPRWEKAGEPYGEAVKPSKAEEIRAANQAREARLKAEKQAKEQAEAETQARDQAALERWQRQPEDYRREIEAHVRPKQPPAMQTGKFFEAVCCLEMLDREARSAVTP